MPVVLKIPRLSLLNLTADQFAILRALIVGTSIGEGGGMWRALGFNCWFSAWRVRREVAAELWWRMAARRRVWRGWRMGFGGNVMVEEGGWGGDVEVMGVGLGRKWDWG